MKFGTYMWIDYECTYKLGKSTITEYFDEVNI